MATLGNEKKRHHYVPITYLNGFNDASERIFAYRKDKPQNALHLKPSEIAFERYYYSQPLPDGGRDNNALEDFFSTVESPWPSIVDAMQRRQDVNSLLEPIFRFLTMLRVRVPAARDMVELGLAAYARATMRHLDETGHLPPKPRGYEDILDRSEIAIDPHQSIHAMPHLSLGFGRLLSSLGFQIVHNETDLDFITSDNPVVVFDPDVAEEAMLPYLVGAPPRRAELLFPITPKLVLRGLTDLNQDFASRGIRHFRLGLRGEAKRLNRLVARFGYRFVFSCTPTHHALVQKYAALSPVADPITIKLSTGGYKVESRLVFGPRPQKPKWEGKVAELNTE